MKKPWVFVALRIVSWVLLCAGGLVLLRDLAWWLDRAGNRLSQGSSFAGFFDFPFGTTLVVACGFLLRLPEIVFAGLEELSAKVDQLQKSKSEP